MPKFRLPLEMTSEKTYRVTVGTRVNEETKRILEKAAKQGKMTISELVANILDDWVQFYTEQELKKKP